MQCPACGSDLYEVRQDGRWLTAPCLECASRESAAAFVEEVREAQARASVLYADKTLDDFVVEQDHQRRGLDAARTFLDTVERGQPVALVLYSAPTEQWTGYGTGKTHLASAIAGDLRKRGWDVASCVVPDLLSSIRASYGDEAGGTEYDILRTAVRTDLLVLDELGLEHVTDKTSSMSWHKEKMYRIVNARYLHGPLVVTTNLDPAGQMQTSIGGAAFSRLWEMTGKGERFVDMGGPDWRFRDDR